MDDPNELGDVGTRTPSLALGLVLLSATVPLVQFLCCDYDCRCIQLRAVAPSEKPKVIEYLFAQYQAGKVPGGIVTNEQIQAAIDETGARLRKANPANFLKDIIRHDNASESWPEALKLNRVTARQRYGEHRVFQFVPYAGDQDEPFPNRFLPTRKTQVHFLQSASMSFVSRRLGRTEETWLTQIAVNLRIVETQLSIFSPLGERLRDVAHLQMGMKTQPEIDAVFLASYGETPGFGSGVTEYVLVTCEAKQIGERILEDQIKEQVAKAMEITRSIEAPKINAVKPLAIKVVRHEFAALMENVIYLVEFDSIRRDLFEAQWEPTMGEERLYSMPLMRASDTIYRVTPVVGGLHG